MDNSGKVIFDLCGGTGSWSKPYEEAGYDVRIITLPEYDVCEITCCSVIGNPCLLMKNHSRGEFETINVSKVYGILAAPPCTEFSILNCKAEARNRDEEAGMQIVNACKTVINYVECNSKDLKFWAMENPVGYLRQYAGKPIFTFQPWEFGDPWTKRTDIWGNFNIPIKKYTDWEDVSKLPIYTRPNREKPSIAYLHKSAQALIPQLQCFQVKTDADFRAITPPGFAKAFYEANR
jgi:hypothetical protein